MHPYRDAFNTDYTPGELAWFRHPLSFIVVALICAFAGCARLAHVEPDLRDEDQRVSTSVRVESHCGDDVMLLESLAGSGVVISERHVLTAAHVTRCPILPRVYVILGNGDRHRVAVVREDFDADIAKLELMHAGRFGLNVAPPMLAGPWDRPTEVTDYMCAYVPGEPRVCGQRIDDDLFLAEMNHGDSGAPTYERGYLVGLVVRVVPLQSATRVTIVGPTWLEGT